jgi:hypothetical protein
VISPDFYLKINSEEEFERAVWKTFHFQIENCSVYRDYVRLLDKLEANQLKDIPFLPIFFFKSHSVTSGDAEVSKVFQSSGTTGMKRSKHHVIDLDWYEKSYLWSYEKFIGSPQNQVILALLPNYLEQGDSSLVYMVHDLIQQSQSSLSGFVLNDVAEISKRYDEAIGIGKQVVIFGVSYALLDLADQNIDLSKALVIETGGMKGRREELSKAELHAILKEKLNLSAVYSEYGMTELLSQAYSKKDGIFHCPPWMKVVIRDVYDPFQFQENGKRGGVNIIDLANIYSCSFIATQDMGRLVEEGFVLEGRLEMADLRGCNLLID